MKNNRFDSEHKYKFKELADKLSNISNFKFDENMTDDSDFFNIFSKLVSEELSKDYEPVTEEELYEEIVDNFFIVIKELGIKEFNFFRFSSYDDCREIIIDGKEYDLDCEFYNDDEDASGALCAIDCLIADLENEDESAVLKKTERIINIRNQKTE